jgi:hypothetical protein
LPCSLPGSLIGFLASVSFLGAAVDNLRADMNCPSAEGPCVAGTLCTPRSSECCCHKKSCRRALDHMFVLSGFRVSWAPGDLRFRS